MYCYLAKVGFNRFAIIILDAPWLRWKPSIKFKNIPHKNFVGAEIIINWFMSPRKIMLTAEWFTCNYYDV